MTLEEAEARREELYNSLTDINQRIDALNERIDILNETRAAVRQMIKDLEIEVAELELVCRHPLGVQ